jgi:nitrogen-specific signal transduction histidine kinase
MRMDKDDLSRMNKVLRHRLRNFASGVKNAMTLLECELSEQLPPASREYFPLIKGECDQLNALTQRLSLLFDEDCPPRAAARQNGDAVTVQSVVDRVLAQIRQEFPTARVVSCIDDATLASTLAGGSALVLALLEVVRNAVEASGTKEVSMGCAREDGFFSFRVTDAGPGAGPGGPSQMFLPFHTTRSKHMGIGLSIARDVLAERGGLLTAVNNAAGGLTVTARIPETNGDAA